MWLQILVYTFKYSLKSSWEFQTIFMTKDQGNYGDTMCQQNRIDLANSCVIEYILVGIVPKTTVNRLL